MFLGSAKSETLLLAGKTSSKSRAKPVNFEEKKQMKTDRRFVAFSSAKGRKNSLSPVPCLPSPEPLSPVVCFLIALDQAVNTLIRIDGEWGTPDETLSARAHRVREKHPAWSLWIDRVFFRDREKRETRIVRHCELSYEAELRRAHLPKSYRARRRRRKRRNGTSNKNE
jgi:hypothetical protein